MPGDNFSLRSQQNRPQRAAFSGSWEENALGPPGFYGELLQGKNTSWDFQLQASRALQGAQHTHTDILSNPTPWSFPTKPCVVPAGRGEAAGMGRAGLEWKQKSLGKSYPTQISLSTAWLKILTSCCRYTPENAELEQSKEVFRESEPLLGDPECHGMLWFHQIPGAGTPPTIPDCSNLALDAPRDGAASLGNLSCKFQMKIKPSRCL